MAGRNIILNLLVSVVLVYGVVGERNVLPENASSEQLGAKPKLPVKTVTTEHGDVYDCIDFFDQPAFDHPLLKNHDYHFDMKPSFTTKEIRDRAGERSNVKSVGCPRGTVPIRRTNRETFIEERPQADDNSLIYYAGTATKDGIGKIYGASSYLSEENPKVYDASQFSSSIISIQADDEHIHAGWTVNPNLYGDYNTRFYIWMHAANASCYNVKCPGFVITNNETPIDRIIKTYPDGPRYETRVLVHQEKETGKWWLVGHNGKAIGFWPKSLFNKLSDGAFKVYFGGVAGASPGKTSFPQMGMGNRPHNDKIRGNGVSRHMMIMNQDGVEEYAASKSDILETLSERYAARNLHMHWYNRKKNFASTLLFGGA